MAPWMIIVPLIFLTISGTVDEIISTLFAEGLNLPHHDHQRDLVEVGHADSTSPPVADWFSSLFNLTMRLDFDILRPFLNLLHPLSSL